MVTGVRQLPLEVSVGSFPTGATPFIWGPENALLDVLLTRLLQPIPTVVPVTIYGPSGTGKSLLLHHLLKHWNAHSPCHPGRSTTGRDWAKQVQSATADAQLGAWRTSLREVGFLALDDVDVLHRFPAAERELMLLIDDFAANRVPMIVTSRRLPATAPLSPALASRLSNGLCLPIRLPEQSTRHQFITLLSAKHNWVFDESAMQWLSNQLRGSFLDIQSQLTAHLSHRTGRLSKQHVLAAFQSSADRRTKVSRCADGSTRSPKKSAQLLGRLVSRFFQVTVTDLKGKSRRKTLVRARCIACHVAREELGMSYYEIGKWLGNRDHSTIIHANRQAKMLIQNEPEVAQWVGELSTTLRRHSHEH